MTKELAGTDAVTPPMFSTGLGLVEFAELVAGGKLKPYQKEMLDALERGEKMGYAPCTNRRYYKDLYTLWREYLKRIDAPDVKQSPYEQS